jgi:hypothetical protein
LIVITSVLDAETTITAFSVNQTDTELTYLTVNTIICDREIAELPARLLREAVDFAPLAGTVEIIRASCPIRSPFQ